MSSLRYPLIAVIIAPQKAPVANHYYAQPDQLIAANWWKWEDDPTKPGPDPVPAALINTRAGDSGFTWMVPYVPPPELEVEPISVRAKGARDA